MNITNYLKETRSELRHVNWLSRRDTIAYTILVVLISVVVALFLGAFDVLFSYLLELFIKYVG
jgi:preprotein translocase subunit SecE